MADVYLRIAEQPAEVTDAIAESMDKRAAEPAMRKICADYMRDFAGPEDNLLEIGCGNGASTEMLVDFLQPKSLTGVDPSAALLAKAKERFSNRSNISFEIGSTYQTRQQDEAFDAVVAHTVYSHIADHQAALAEALRILKPGGRLVIFDGDYATNTVALFDGDPLQATMQAAQRNIIHDPYIMRRLPGMLRTAGFDVTRSLAHGYVQTESPDYLLTLISRAVDLSVSIGEIEQDLAEGLKAEAQSRVKSGNFYGAILFISLVATKPG